MTFSDGTQAPQAGSVGIEQLAPGEALDVVITRSAATVSTVTFT